MDNKDKMKFDSFPCSMGIVKQEREDDYDEGERGPCSLEMIKQEMEEETVVELQSCSADIKQELGGKTKRFPCDKCSEVFDSAFVRWRHMGDVHQKSHRCSLCNRGQSLSLTFTSDLVSSSVQFFYCVCSPCSILIAATYQNRSQRFS